MEGDYYSLILRELSEKELATLSAGGVVNDHAYYDEYWDIELVPDPNKTLH